MSAERDPALWFYCTTHHLPETEAVLDASHIQVGPFASIEEARDWAKGVQKYRPLDPEPPAEEEVEERRPPTQDELDVACEIVAAMTPQEFRDAARRIGLKDPGYTHHVRIGRVTLSWDRP